MKLFSLFEQLIRNFTQCAYDINHILRIFEKNTKYGKDNLESAWPPIDLAKQGTGYDRSAVVKGYCIQTGLGKHYQ